MSLKVLIVEDDPNWRCLYRIMLKGDADIEIVGEFDNAESALDEIGHLLPDVALVDLSLPGMTGVKLAESLGKFPAIKVIIVSAYESEYVKGLSHQRFSVVNKTCSDELLQKIKEVAAQPA
jgi:DNA-binding NarL/FixJ family response regulator